MGYELDKFLDDFSGEQHSVLLSINKIDKVQSPSERDYAEGLRKEASDLLTRVGKARIALTKPLDTIKKQLMAREKEVTGALKESVDELTELLQKYYDNQVKVSDTEAESIKADYESAQETIDTLEGLVDAETTKSIREALLEDAKRGYREAVDWEVSDESAIPAEYYILNEKLINQDVKDGIAIAGIKVTKKAIRTGR